MRKYFVLAAAVTAALLVSCASKPAAAPAAAAAPAGAKEVPTFVFSGTELKIELEEMYLQDMPVIEKKGATAVFVEKDSSRATAMLTLPAGEYVGLVNEFAPSPDNDAFYVFLDDLAFRCYPSDPPVGGWELTERVPMNISVPADTTFELVVKPHSPSRNGETGMWLDYIILKKK